MKTIQISDELAEAIADQLCADGATDVTGWSELVGQKLFIRTVTYHLVGKVRGVNGTLIELSDAAWVADSGRFMQALQNGALNEVEPCGRCWVNAESITDMFPWNHPLPKAQK